jgi:hypothetical protein
MGKYMQNKFLRRTFVLWVLVLVLAACVANPDSDEENTNADNSAGTDLNDDVISTSENVKYDYALSADRIFIKCEFGVPALTKTQQGKARVTYPGLGNSLNEDDLPFFSLTLAMPIDKTISSITADWSSERELPEIDLEQKQYAAISPDDPNISRNQSALTSVTKHNLYAAASVQSIRGYEITVVKVSPVSYDRKAKKLYFSDTVAIEIPLKNKKWDMPNEIDELDIESVKSLVDNPNDVQLRLS